MPRSSPNRFSYETGLWLCKWNIKSAWKWCFNNLCNKRPSYGCGWAEELTDKASYTTANMRLKNWVTYSSHCFANWRADLIGERGSGRRSRHRIDGVSAGASLTSASLTSVSSHRKSGQSGQVLQTVGYRVVGSVNLILTFHTRRRGSRRRCVICRGRL